MDGYVLPTADFYKIKDFLVAFDSDIFNMSGTVGRATNSCIFCGKAIKAIKSTSLGYGPACRKNWNLDFFDGRKEVFGVYGIMKYQDTIDDIMRLVDEDDIPFFVLIERQRKLKQLISLCTTANLIDGKKHDMDPMDKIRANIGVSVKRKAEEKESPAAKRVKKCLVLL